jgi:hypothetical protein
VTRGSFGGASLAQRKAQMISQCINALRPTGLHHGPLQLDDEDHSERCCLVPHSSQKMSVGHHGEELTTLDVYEMLTPHTRVGLEEGFKPLTDLPSGYGSGFQMRSTDTTYSSSSDGSTSTHSLSDAVSRPSREQPPTLKIDAPQSESQTSAGAELTSDQYPELTPHTRLGLEEGFKPLTDLPSANGSGFQMNSGEASGATSTLASPLR